jgi:hypothetical protein
MKRYHNQRVIKHWVKVETPYREHRVYLWCQRHQSPGRFFHSPLHGLRNYYFERGEDATFFKLLWA